MLCPFWAVARLSTVYPVMRDCANVYVVYSDAINLLSKMRHKALVWLWCVITQGVNIRYRKVAPLKIATACIKVAY